jgi:hypothetical protein
MLVKPFGSTEPDRLVPAAVCGWAISNNHEDGGLGNKENSVWVKA